MNALDDVIARQVIQHLKAEAKLYGVSKLARLAGIPQTTLHAALQDGNNPGFKNIVAIAFRLGYLVTLQRVEK